MKKGQGGSGGGGGGLELKQRIVCALNKVGDRDTQQIGMEELDRVAQGLRPEGIWSFLSCILETEWEQKASIRKECVRLMGTLATYHDTLLLPHLPKMVASIVKRLRDPDSVVRDVCVNTVALLASKLGLALSHKDKVFLLLVKPIFEALGEQNRHVQSASALCLARIIHNTHHPPLSLLHKMLLRTLKLLKNPHFMAKPALLDLTKTLIQAGGAPTQNILSAAIGSIQDALKHSDWTTRKAASVALAEIALGGASFLGCFRASCVQSLESCRFDKVKPVRDAVLQALKYWTTLPAPDTPDPSETGSSLKENICRGDSSDLSSTTESRQKDVRLQKVNMKSTMGRIPLSVKKTCQNYNRNTQHKPDDWHVEVAVPRPHSVVEFQNEESESCSVSKPLETMSADVSSMQDVGYEYVPMDDKQECSSVSNLATDNFETKFLTTHDCFINSGVPKPIARSQRYSEEISSDEQVYSVKMQHPSSSDSTITEPSRRTTHECCMQMANEMICIQNQLSDIEIKQANMIHQLQMFSTGIMDALSTIQSRMTGLENVFDRLCRESFQGGRHSYSETSKLGKQSEIVASPRFSICTPRPSVEINNKQSVSVSVKNSEGWEKRTFSRSQPGIHSVDSSDMWKSYKVKAGRKGTEKDVLNSSAKDATRMGLVKNDGVISASRTTNARNGWSENNTNCWKHVKRLLCEGDLNSAYMEALCFNDEFILVELLNTTGPVVESLSVKTINALLSTLASHLLEGKLFSIIIPWLQQIVEMSTIHGPNCISISMEAKEHLLSAIQEAVNLHIFSHSERRRAAELAMKLHHIWGKTAEN
ncbi:TORTIFOLIA1-like protein 2 [Vigna radiata var. radiata]|uniref:TORTIFOLIA1-like protein 2 n=1 Tax=Vigna radiata var. radiata TaxID=3916 RepID=A0A1S3UTM0_VIGRR|nr:TORTIFOLIA1-like protein 2 [Vigna radiata var. radiata]